MCRPLNFANFSSSSVTCRQSSRVGTMMIAPTVPVRCKRLISGMPKAAVVPEPVCAWPDQVPPFQQRWEDCRLDLRRVGVADRLDRARSSLAEGEVAEAGSVLGEGGVVRGLGRGGECFGFGVKCRRVQVCCPFLLLHRSHHLPRRSSVPDYWTGTHTHRDTSLAHARQPLPRPLMRLGQV